MGKRKQYFNIEPKEQRTVAKMGRMAKGAGKTMRSTRNSKEVRSVIGYSK